MLPWFQWATISLGPFTLQVWGLFVSLGMLLSVWIISRRMVGWGGEREKILDACLWMIVSGFVGARLFHVLFYDPIFFLSRPLEIFQIWHGGMSSFGGLCGALAAFVVFVRKHRMAHQWSEIADVLSFGALFGWMVGRVGCFMIHDHMGAHSSCPFALMTPGGPRLDMALLEIIGLAPLAILFFFARKQPKIHGWYTSILFIYYGVLRFGLDFWRATDIPSSDVRYLGLTPGHYFAILLVLCGGYLWAKIHKK